VGEDDDAVVHGLPYHNESDQRLPGVPRIEKRNIGILEYWNDGVLKPEQIVIYLSVWFIAHYSIVPSFQYSRLQWGFDEAHTQRLVENGSRHRGGGCSGRGILAMVATPCFLPEA
jgi:hypothetical protein